MAQHNRFKEGSGVFTCEGCEKPTRDTGHDEAELRLCKKCLFKAYMDNAAGDYGLSSQEYAKAKKDYESLK